jgi:hypothetical protein
LIRQSGYCQRRSFPSRIIRQPALLAEAAAFRTDRSSCRRQTGMHDESQAQAKSKYEPPRVTVISLRPEEAVLAACKTQRSAGPVSSGCQATHGGACRGHGS